MIETSLVFPESIQQFLDIFGNVRKCSENARERKVFGLGKSLESGWKSSENCQKRRHQCVDIKKENIAC